MSLFILLNPLIDSNEFKAHCVFFMAIMACSITSLTSPNPLLPQKPSTSKHTRHAHRCCMLILWPWLPPSPELLLLLLCLWLLLLLQVGVAMSLFILLDPLIDNDEFKAHCVFFMAIMAFSTVLINGTTAKYVLEGLGLLKMTPQQLDVLQYVLKVRQYIAECKRYPWWPG